MSEPKEEKIKELFAMVYWWGRSGKIADENTPAYRDLINEIIS